jgi:hypothetical protein
MAKKQKTKARDKAHKKSDDIEMLGAVDFKPAPGEFDADAFNEAIEADRCHAYLALAALHKSKAELARAFVEEPDLMKKMTMAGIDTVKNLRELADNVELACARMLGAAASLA